MGIQKALIWVAVLAGLAIMVWGVVSLNNVSERLSRVESKLADIQGRSLAGIEERLDAIESKLP